MALSQSKVTVYCNALQEGSETLIMCHNFFKWVRSKLLLFYLFCLKVQWNVVCTHMHKSIHGLLVFLQLMIELAFYSETKQHRLSAIKVTEPQLGCTGKANANAPIGSWCVVGKVSESWVLKDEQLPEERALILDRRDSGYRGKYWWQCGSNGRTLKFPSVHYLSQSW